MATTSSRADLSTSPFPEDDLIADIEVNVDVVLMAKLATMLTTLRASLSAATTSLKVVSEPRGSTYASVEKDANGCSNAVLTFRLAFSPPTGVTATGLVETAGDIDVLSSRRTMLPELKSVPNVLEAEAKV